MPEPGADVEPWRSFTPQAQTHERLTAFVAAVRARIPEMDAADLDMVEAMLVGVAARLRHLGKSAIEAQQTRVLALRRLGELLGPAEPGRPPKAEAEMSGAADINHAERDRRHLARTLADPANRTLVDAELDGEHPASPSRLLRLIQRNRSLATTPLPDRRYAVLLADPPWRYDGAEAANRQIENQYPTMSLDAIKALQVPAADDCVLFLWATSPKLTEALAVMAAWGFTYRTAAVWVKDRIGMGYYFRQQHELLLVGKRGDLPAPRPEDRPASVITGRRGEHSVKPAGMYEAIEAMYPWVLADPPEVCELFQRAPRKGWDGWGNEKETAQ